MTRDQIVESLAIRAALGNNGGAWATHYDDIHKEHWRQFVRDLMREAEKIARVKALEEAAKLVQETGAECGQRTADVNDLVKAIRERAKEYERSA
jgi:hypothetical protein